MIKRFTLLVHHSPPFCAAVIIAASHAHVISGWVTSRFPRDRNATALHIASSISMLDLIGTSTIHSGIASGIAERYNLSSSPSQWIVLNWLVSRDDHATGDCVINSSRSAFSASRSATSSDTNA